MGPGSDARDCATKLKPVCWVEVERSLKYVLSPAFH